MCSPHQYNSSVLSQLHYYLGHYCKISTLFDIAFPLRQIYIRKTTDVTWITQGIRISSKKVRLFNLIKKHMTLPMGATLYIAKYKSIYKRVINEAKRRKNDRILIQANNKPKAIWKIIKDEVGRSSTITHDIRNSGHSD